MLEAWEYLESGGTMLFKICLKDGGVNLDQPSLQARYLHQLKNLCTRKVTSKGAPRSRNLESMQLNKMYIGAKRSTTIKQ